jgi:hypothetical protein
VEAKRRLPWIRRNWPIADRIRVEQHAGVLGRLHRGYRNPDRQHEAAGQRGPGEGGADEAVDRGGPARGQNQMVAVERPRGRPQQMLDGPERPHGVVQLGGPGLARRQATHVVHVERRRADVTQDVGLRPVLGDRERA